MKKRAFVIVLIIYFLISGYKNNCDCKYYDKFTSFINYKCPDLKINYRLGKYRYFDKDYPKKINENETKIKEISGCIEKYKKYDSPDLEIEILPIYNDTLELFIYHNYSNVIFKYENSDSIYFYKAKINLFDEVHSVAFLIDKEERFNPLDKNRFDFESLKTVDTINILKDDMNYKTIKAMKLSPVHEISKK